jgi:hypothetical protein
VKKLVISSGLAAAAVLMLLPVTRPVNAAIGNVRTNGTHLQADGDPLPPPIPPSKVSVGGAYLQADGDPLPPPIPPANGTSVTPYFLADGDPLPPPIPPTETAFFVEA